jgi:hypothetical protein
VGRGDRVKDGAADTAPFGGVCSFEDWAEEEDVTEEDELLAGLELFFGRPLFTRGKK